MAAPVIVEDLVVRYDDLIAVDHVSFQADAGKVTAVLGPNGAGKTTTIEVCEGFRRPTAGRAFVLGLQPETHQRQLSMRMGVMLQEGGVSPAARVGDVVALYCRLYGRGVEPGALLERVGLGEKSSATYRRLSGGEKQRVSLALALAAKPEVAFLDEPTSGVDVAGRQLIRDVVRALAGEGCAVVLATHELDEAEKLADQVVIFDRGRIVADGTLDELRRGHDEIRFTTADDLDVDALSADLGVAVTALGGGAYVAAAGTERVGALSAWLEGAGLVLTDVRAGRQRLEDVFVRLTGEHGGLPENDEQ